MLTNISWDDYCITIGVLVLIWYMFLGVLFYHRELKQILSGKKGIKVLATGSVGTNESHSIFTSSMSKSFDTSKVADEFTSILSNAVKECKERNLSKEEFQVYLKLILEDYPDIKYSGLRAIINELIVSECEKHPQLILNYAEIDVLWEEIN